MKAKQSAVSVVMACVIFTAGCHQFRVDSYPQGAKIIVDGVDSGERTPRAYSPRHFDSGVHKVTVEKEGYTTVTEPRNSR